MIECGSWKLWYRCKICHHDYGFRDPLFKYFDQCCPSCGASEGSVSPPRYSVPARICVTFRPSFFQRVILRKKEEWHYEYKEDQVVSEGGGDTIIASKSARFSSTAISIGAASNIF